MVLAEPNRDLFDKLSPRFRSPEDRTDVLLTNVDKKVYQFFMALIGGLLLSADWAIDVCIRPHNARAFAPNLHRW